MKKEQRVLISQNVERGLKKAIVSDKWMIQILNYMPKLVPDQIASMQKHLLSDESFILIDGKALLFEAGNDSQPGEIVALLLQPQAVYTVPKGVWHAISLAKGGKVIIVENADTLPENSPRCELTEIQKNVLCKAAKVMTAVE